MDDAFIARAAFSGLDAKSGAGAGVTATGCDGLGLATMAVRKGRLSALSARLGERYGIELPRGHYRTEARGIAFAGTGPEVWLVTQENGGNDFAASLRTEIGALASVTDQSDGYAVLRLAGPKLRQTLAKLVPLDLHPRAFPSGDIASTMASHMGLTLWRLQDRPDGSPVFEIAVFRSLARDFWHALSESAAEFGLVAADSR